MRKVSSSSKTTAARTCPFQKCFHHRKTRGERLALRRSVDVTDESRRYILFASGFLLSETSVIFNQLENLVNALTQSTNVKSKAIQSILSNTVRFVVAGNLIDSSNRLKETTNQVSENPRSREASSLRLSLGEILDTQDDSHECRGHAQHR